MSLRDLDIEVAYDTGNYPENVIKSFYVPVLNQAIIYKRLTGYFSSQVLALAARGIAGLIKNGGRMQLITSPVVSEKDFAALTSEHNDSLISFIDKQFEIAMQDINDLTSVIAYDHIRALGWMLREGHLEIKVLVPSDIKSGTGIFHSKVGIVEDSDGNQVSFSGSVNETAMGWSQNIEEFKVFKSWEPGNQKWVDHDIDLFNKYWSHAKDSGFEAIPLPSKSVEQLVSIAPNDIEELALIPKELKTELKLRKYQEEAISAWESSDYRGILEMATGTGKTFTSRQCIERWKQSKSDSIILVTAPTQTVASQWVSVLKDLSPIATFESGPWREKMNDLASSTSLSHTNHLVVVAIQNTASSKDFLEKFDHLSKFTKNRLIIADEVHGLGAPSFQKALNSDIPARLGLTATPNRWFDESGTKVLLDYFGGVVYKFGLHEALTWVDPDTNQTPLCPYHYYPAFADLDSIEIEEYLSLTKRIIMQSNKTSSKEEQEKLNRLQEKRAAVLKKAHAKIPLLRGVLKSLKDPTGTLIYCSDTEQMNSAIEVISDFPMTYRTFTGQEGTTPRKEFGGKSQRDSILESFENREIQVLVAMKCLDEGVDIPSAKTGIIMASTTNPREFIQRRGRLLRRSAGKEMAEIYDLIVAPKFDSDAQSEEVIAARSIMKKELLRVEEFAEDASNVSDIASTILGRMLEMGTTNEG